MEYHIREHVDTLFADAPNTQKAYEMKMELAENLIEKYHGLIEDGKTPEDAYNLTILSIGDVRELFDSLQDEAYGEVKEQERHNSKKTATFTAAALMLYILSFIPPMLMSSHMGAVAMVIMWAAGTGLIVYAQMTKPRSYRRSEETVVSEFKDWQAKKANNKQLRRALSTILWPLLVVIYMLISFTTMKWYITWVIFPLGVAIEGIITSVFNLKA